MPSPHFDAFVAPARPTAALWRTLLGAGLIALVYAGSFAAALGTVLLLLGPAAARTLALSLVEPRSPAVALFLLGSFVGMATGPLVVVRLVHRRALGTLFGRPPRVLRDFVIAALTVGGLYAFTFGLWSLPYDARPNLDPASWAALLPLTLCGILLQTGAEELVFRGYLTQQLAARFRTPLVWAVLPSLLFGLIHYAPAMHGANAAMVIGGATLFGLLATDLTAATGSLGAAWGFHFANNVMALAVLATDGGVTGLALYVTPYAADEAGVARLALAADYGGLVAAWALCRLVLVRRRV